MDNIKVLSSTMIIIFPVDEIDLSVFTRIETVNMMLQNYRLNVAPPQLNPFAVNQNQITFQNGEFNFENDVYQITELSIDERRIIIKMFSHTDITKKFFNSLRTDIIDIDSRKKKVKYEPLLITFETICVCNLDIDLLDMFTDHVKTSFLEESKGIIPTHKSSISFIPHSMRFRIEYFDLPSELRKNKIALSDKFLTIEYREKTDPDDRLYFTSSPTESETHFKLLDSLEKYSIN